MDWLKDKKNQPIVIGGSVVILLGAIVFLLFQFGVLGGSGSTEAIAPPPVAGGPGLGVPPEAGHAPGGPPQPGQVPGGPPQPGQAPGAPVPTGGPPGTPGAPVAAAPAGGAKTAAVVPKKVGTGDPFKAPASALPATLRTKPVSVASYLPYVYIVRTQPKATLTQTVAKNKGGDIGPPEVSTTQRMSGVLFTDKGIVGLLETNGQTQQVYPGDTVNDGSARVISIQSDGLTLRRTSDNHLVRVPLSGVSTGPGAGAGDVPVPVPPDNGGNGNGTDTPNPGNDNSTDNL